MKIARLHMDAQDKLRFEIHGKSSVKYHLKANHQVEAKRWFWALNNAIQWTKDEAKDDKQDLCTICLELITERAVAVPCNHLTFDYLCLIQALEQRAQWYM